MKKGHKNLKEPSLDPDNLFVKGHKIDLDPKILTRKVTGKESNIY